MKYGEILPEDTLESLPKIAREEVRLLWVDAYHDAPLNGMLKYQGASHRFQMHNTDDWIFGEDEYSAPRYLVIELSPQQLAELEYWHDLFARKVWNGWDYGEDQRVIWNHHREQITRGTQAEHDEFYEMFKHRKPLDYSNNSVVGWFER